MKKGRLPEQPKKTPDDDLQKMPHIKSLIIQAPTETWTYTLALVADAC